MKTIYSIFIALFLLLNSSSIAYANLHDYPNQPDGFGGFNWGIDLSDFPTSDAKIFYSKTTTDGYSDITYSYHSLLFRFLNNKLQAVDIFVPDIDSYNTFKNKIQDLFGPGEDVYKTVNGNDIFVATEWFGTKTLIFIPPYHDEHITITFMDSRDFYDN